MAPFIPFILGDLPQKVLCISPTLKVRKMRLK